MITCEMSCAEEQTKAPWFKQDACPASASEIYFEEFEGSAACP